MSHQAPGHLVILLLQTSPGLAEIRSLKSSIEVNNIEGIDPALKLVHEIENIVKIKGKCKT